MSCSRYALSKALRVTMGEKPARPYWVRELLPKSDRQEVMEFVRETIEDLYNYCVIKIQSVALFSCYLDSVYDYSYSPYFDIGDFYADESQSGNMKNGAKAVKWWKLGILRDELEMDDFLDKSRSAVTFTENWVMLIATVSVLKRTWTRHWNIIRKAMKGM